MVARPFPFIWGLFRERKDQFAKCEMENPNCCTFLTGLCKRDQKFRNSLNESLLRYLYLPASGRSSEVHSSYFTKTTPGHLHMKRLV
jgi:hypothetical protein